MDWHEKLDLYAAWHALRVILKLRELMAFAAFRPTPQSHTRKCALSKTNEVKRRPTNIVTIIFIPFLSLCISTSDSWFRVFDAIGSFIIGLNFSNFARHNSFNICYIETAKTPSMCIHIENL